MKERTLLARTAALALGAIFVLPSCFTFNLWRTGNRPTSLSVNGAPAGVAPTAAGSTRIVCRLSADSRYPAEGATQVLTELCAQWRPPLAPGDWVAVEPIEHAEAVASIWRDHPADCGLQVVRNTAEAAAPRCLFVFPRDPVSSVPDDLASLPGVRSRGGYFGAKRVVFEAECRIAPTAAPQQAPVETMSLQLCDPPSGTMERVLVTPLTLVLDTVFLPFELIGLPAWW